MTLLAVACLATACGGGDDDSAPAGPTVNPQAFNVHSPDLASGSFATEFTLNGFGCTGGNASPAIVWTNPPTGTKGYALTVLDLDVQTGSGIWHWAVYNIPASATGLPRGAGNSQSALPVPAYGGNTDFRDTGLTGTDGSYAGPCPAAGDRPHRYQFTLYAYGVDDLPVAGGIPRTASAALYSYVLNNALGSQLLGKASFTASYGR